MNIIKESPPMNGANELQFLKNTLINLLAANKFGTLMTYSAEEIDEKLMESKLLANLLNDTQQQELY